MVLPVLSDPCAPNNVTVRLQCLNNTAVVSWEGSPSAVGYNVTAVGRDGDIKYSTVTGTSCQLPNMHCGQTYEIVITPFSHTCTGFPTAPYTFNAGVYWQLPQIGCKLLSHTAKKNIFFLSIFDLFSSIF